MTEESAAKRGVAVPVDHLGEVVEHVVAPVSVHEGWIFDRFGGALRGRGHRVAA